MAFQMTIKNNYEEDVPNAYIRIRKIVGDKNGMTIYMGTYKKDGNNFRYIKDLMPDSTNNIESHFSIVPDISDTAENIYKQIYLALKNRPEFSQAIDV